MASHPNPTEEHLRFILDVHASDPGLTERSLGLARTEDGRSSYEVFCDFARPVEGSSVVDLACGNGPLTAILAERVGSRGQVLGIDLSAEEIAAARERLRAHANVRVLRAGADQTSLADSSVDLVVCHMAFMLFTPLSPVVAEMARILRSGGAFAAVVPTMRRPSALFAACASSLKAALASAHPEQEAVSGNAVRLGGVDDIRAVFPREQWAIEEIPVSDINVFISAPPDELLQLVSPAFYNYRLLPVRLRQVVDEKWCQLFTQSCDGEGRARFDFPLSAFSVKRR